MGSNRAQLEKKVAELTKKTKANKQVVQGLVEHFEEKASDNCLDRASVRDDLMIHFDMLDDFLLDRVFRTFDCSASTRIKVDDYVMGMVTLLTGSLDDRIRFCFNVYDLNGDGYITRDEVLQLLKHCMVNNKSHDAEDDAEEGIKELSELAIKRLDLDRDGRVSFKDFQNSVNEEILGLELLGQCLPDFRCREQFLRLLGDPHLNAQPSTMSSRSRTSSVKGSKHSEQQRCSQQKVKR